MENVITAYVQPLGLPEGRVVKRCVRRTSVKQEAVISKQLMKRTARQPRIDEEHIRLFANTRAIAVTVGYQSRTASAGCEGVTVATEVVDGLFIVAAYPVVRLRHRN